MVRRLLVIGGAGVAIVVAIPVIARQWLQPQNGATMGDIVRWLLVLAVAQTAGWLIRWTTGAALVQTLGVLLLLWLPRESKWITVRDVIAVDGVPLTVRDRPAAGALNRPELSVNDLKGLAAVQSK